jgi:cytoskeletal protein CcmA (bactofilin family)
VLKSFVIDKNGVRIETAPRTGGGPGMNIKIDPTQISSRVVIGHGDSGIIGVHGPGIVVDTDGAGLVRVFADAEVPAGERIEGDVVAVFGSVLVEGTVSGNVVAVFGSVRLAPESSVEGDVVAIGGGLDQARGATVGGESVSLGFLPTALGMPALPVLLISVFIGWLLSIYVGWIVTLLIPERMLRVAATASRRGVASFFLGLVSTPLMLFSCMLLLITVIGIPIALLLPLLFVLMAWAGQIASTYVLGSRLLHRRLGQGGAMRPILAGALFVALFFAAGAVLATPPGFPRTAALFFSLLGVLLVFCLTTIGTGAFLLSRFGTRPPDVSFEREPGPAAIPQIPAGVTAPPSPTEA